jgi:hypothetical protein
MTLHVVRVPDGSKARVRKFKGSFVVSTETSGMSPSIPSSDPSFRGDFLFVHDFGYTVARKIAKTTVVGFATAIPCVFCLGDLKCLDLRGNTLVSADVSHAASGPRTRSSSIPMHERTHSTDKII